MSHLGFQPMKNRGTRKGKMLPSNKGKASQAGFPLCSGRELQLIQQEQEIAACSPSPQLGSRDLGVVIK